MKSKRINSLLSLLLAAVMAFSQPMAVFAEEASTVAVEEVTEEVETSEASTEEESSVEEVSTEETSVEETTAGETVEESTEEVSTQTVVEEQTEVEETTVSETVEETTTEETTETVEETSVEETTLEETTEEATMEELQAEDAKIAAQLEVLGFQTMSLDSRMIEEKAVHAQVVSSISSMEAGKDYVANEILYLADSEEEAEQIAQCYGGILREYNYGTATAVIDASAEDAIKLSANPKVELPAVYPNVIYSICTEGNSVAEATFEGEPVLVDEADVEREEFPVQSNELELPCDDEQLYATAPNDTYYSSQWYHDTLNTVEAWNATKGDGVVVAVIDSGIDYEHPDLKDNIVGHTETITKSIDENGEEQRNYGDGRDDNGHGTHCAGIIAAVANNSKGISGVAPEAKIYSIKALGEDGFGDTSDITEAVYVAIDQNVDVISMSLGGIMWDKLYEKAIKAAVNKGIVVVAAAGNESTSQKTYPAAFADVISVAATKQDNGLTYFSNYGKWVNIAAPGYNILSTVPTNFTRDNLTYAAPGYAYMNGTSMACPAVAGTVALMLSNNENLRTNNKKANVTKVTNTLLNSAVPNGAEYYWYDDPNDAYPLADAEATTFAVDETVPEKPIITFSSTPNNKNVVLAGAEEYFELSTTTPHSKIYYTTNGKKPTIATGNLYTGKIYMPTSGKVKIQAITAVGSKTSKVFSKTYTFDAKATGLSSTCDEELTVAVGKSIQLSVDVAPSYTRVKKLVWSSNDKTGMIKVNKNNGKVTCNKRALPGTEAEITATTTDGSDLTYTFHVTAIKEKATAVTLNAKELKMLTLTRDVYEYFGVELKEGYVSSFQLTPVCEGTEADQFTYKTSNKKVATVDAYGNITPIGSGKANITVTANDGSGKKAVCKVTVVNPVFDIYMYSSTGFSEYSDYIPIGTGYSITLKPEINYGETHYAIKPKNKNLVWSSDNELVTVNQKGKVTCSKDAVPGTEVTITAKAADGFGTEKSVTFLVTDGITKLTYTYPVYNSKGVIVGFRESGTSFSAVLSHNYGTYDFWENLNVYTRGNTAEGYVDNYWFTNSKPDIAYREYTSDNGWVIWGTKPGKTKIVYTARDGSNKKFTLNLTVKAKK